MSAECHIHGTDLVGHQFSEGGLVCPSCERDKEIENWRVRYEALEARVEELCGALELADEHLHPGGDERKWAVKDAIRNALSAFNDQPTSKGEE